MNDVMQTMADLRSQMWLSGIRQVDVAQRLGMDPARFSRILNGRNPVPALFERRVRQAITEISLDRAEQSLAANGAA